jgi:hypothetical protein
LHYRFVGTAPVLIPDLHRVVSTGEEFESELAFSPGDFERLDEAIPSLADLDVSEPPKEVA